MHRLPYGLIILFLCCSFAAETLARADEAIENFVKDVRPLLAAKCVSCHGPEKQEGGLRLDSAATAAKGGELGPAVVPGDAGRSLLVKAITFRDPDSQMPPKQKLSDREIAILTGWVKSGATWPDTAAGADHPDDDGSSIGDAFTDERNPVRRVFSGARLDLWSLRKPVAVPLPEEFANLHPIDSFVRERLQNAGLELSPEADRLRADMMSDLTNTTAAAFLGLTMSCCQCHDYKYDPLLQADHYRLRAFFAGVTPRDDLAISLADEQAEIDRHNAELEQRITSVKSELESLDRNQWAGTDTTTIPTIILATPRRRTNPSPRC